MEFKDLTFIHDHQGFSSMSRARVQFANGYGASVIIGDHSYGGSDGLYELAVLDKDGSLTYDTPITSDVLGYLTPKDVTSLLQQIAALPPVSQAERAPLDL
jgi:hypothetical protein